MGFILIMHICLFILNWIVTWDLFLWDLVKYGVMFLSFNGLFPYIFVFQTNDLLHTMNVKIIFQLYIIWLTLPSAMDMLIWITIMFVGQKAHNWQKQTFLVHALADLWTALCSSCVLVHQNGFDDGENTSQTFVLTVLCTSCGSFYIRIISDVSKSLSTDISELKQSTFNSCTEL